MDNKDNTASFWWRSDLEDEIHDIIFSYVEHLEDVSAGEFNKDMVHAILYHNNQGFSGPFAAAMRFLSSTGMSSIKLNISKNIVDTLTAKIGKNTPSVKVATDGADWSARLKGKRLGKFINAKISETELMRITPLIFRDACIRGTGIIKISAENNELLPERVLKGDILIDPIEARYGKPRQLHQKYVMSREVVAELFPDARVEIMDAPAATEEDIYSDDLGGLSHSSTNSNMIKIVESWHLPSGPEAKDGRHSICIKGKTLLLEEWNRTKFPFAFLHWSAPDKGFWGTGLIEELAPIQWEIDSTVQCIADSLSIAGKLKVFIPRSSKIVKTQLNNKIGSITEFSGNPPIFHTPQPVSEQMFRYLEYLFNKGFEISGLSQLSSQSKLPARMGDSAPAIQTFYDIETERFSQQALAYRNLYLDVAEQFVDLAKEIYAGNESYKGKWVDRSLVEEIRWEDVDLNRDQFKLKLEALNLIPDTRAGKMQTIKELTEIGILPQQLLGTALQSPDLERVYAAINAAHNNIEWVIGLIEDTSVPIPEPEPYQDLQLGINLVKAAYNEAQASGAPEEVLERFHEWLGAAVALIKMGKAQTSPQVAPGGAPAERGAVAAPMAPPALETVEPMPPPEGPPVV